MFHPLRDPQLQFKPEKYKLNKNMEYIIKYNIKILSDSGFYYLFVYYVFYVFYVIISSMICLTYIYQILIVTEDPLKGETLFYN